MIWFEQVALPAIVGLGLVGTIGWSIYWDRRDTVVAARRKALGEAADALDSLAYIANGAIKGHQDRGDTAGAWGAYTRVHYYSQAASIVRSIPVDRV